MAGIGADGRRFSFESVCVNAYGGTPYGSLTAPVDFGSGGGSYLGSRRGRRWGGGAIRLNVAGMLMLDGRISADGSPGLAEGSGGGSGGSVWLTVGTLTGAGTSPPMAAMGNGFGLTGGGGGGGGRIAIQYGMNLFFGASTARGGSGSAWGGAGTIYTKANSQSWGQVLVDNGGQAGANTSWLPMGTVDLTVKGGAAVVPPKRADDWHVAGRLQRVADREQPSLDGDRQRHGPGGGGIIADSAGYAASVRPGSGEVCPAVTSGYIGGGGGYGGYGAAGASPSTPSSALWRQHLWLGECADWLSAAAEAATLALVMGGAGRRCGSLST